MWPRSGGDRGNRNVSSVVGPALQRIAHVIPGWIALSADSLARLSPDGTVQWAHAHGGTGPRWRCYQPLVDPRGTIYIVADHEIHTFDGAGQALSRIALRGQPMPLFPVRPGVLGTIVDDALVLVE